MKILLDECVPKNLSKYIKEHEVNSVTQQGWTGIKNGALLKLASTEFELFLTVDKNLSFSAKS